jgi:hypothetical protein
MLCKNVIGLINCTHNSADLVKLVVVYPFDGWWGLLFLGDGRFLRRKQHKLCIKKKFVHLHLHKLRQNPAPEYPNPNSKTNCFSSKSVRGAGKVYCFSIPTEEMARICIQR